MEEFSILDGEYMDMVRHVRSKKTGEQNGDPYLVKLRGDENEVEVGIDPENYYLVSTNGNPISKAEQSYTTNNRIWSQQKFFVYDHILQALKTDADQMTGLGKSYYSSLIFIVAEAARFHVFARNVNNLIQSRHDSNKAINFDEAKLLIRNYGPMCKSVGWVKGKDKVDHGSTQPLNDSQIHRWRYSAIADDKVDKDFQKTKSIQHLIGLGQPSG